MQKKLLLITIFLLTISSNIIAETRCFIKIGFGDCINCYNVLSILNDFDKTYVFNETYKGSEKEILHEYLGLEGDNIKIETSDSLYNSFGYDDFTAIIFIKDGKVILKFPMSKLGLYSTNIRILQNNINTETNITDTIDISKHWLPSNELKINSNQEIYILNRFTSVPLKSVCNQKLNKFGSLRLKRSLSF